MKAVLLMICHVDMVTHQLVKDVLVKWIGELKDVLTLLVLFGLLITVTLLTGNVNSNIFCSWVIQDLLPKLPPRCVIVMDNASFHKRLDIQNSIREAGHTLLFLPPYSPQLNPIEHKWAQAKAIRKQKYCSIYDLFTLYNI